MHSQHVPLKFILIVAFSAGAALGGEEQPPPIEDLIRGLGDSSWQVREDCQRALLERGIEAVAPLRAALSSADPEIVLRSRVILGLIDPLRIRIRIQRIEMEKPPRISETLEGEVGEGEEIQLPARLEAAERPAGFAVQCRIVGEDGVDLLVDEVMANSAVRNSLGPPSPRAGAAAILKRGEESTYRQVGFHIERERRPFAIILRWWSTRSGGSTSSLPEADLPSLVRDLIDGIRSEDGRAKLAALDLLMLLGVREAEAAFRAAMGAPSLRTPCLLGLARLGDREAVAELEAMLDEEPGAAPAGNADSSTGVPPIEGRRRQAPAFEGQIPEVVWGNRALLLLVERGSRPGLEALARRLTVLDSTGLRPALAVLADLIGRDPAALTPPVLDAIASTEFLSHLGWEDPEIEHFFGKLLEDPGTAGNAAFLRKLFMGLARSLGTDPWYGTSRPRVLARIWKRTASRSEDDVRAMLREVLSGPAGASRTAEVATWLKLCFNEEPMPEDGFGDFLQLVRSTLGRGEEWGQVGPAALLDLAQSMALTERQFVGLAGLLAEAAAAPGQPYAAQYLREVDRITGLGLAVKLRGSQGGTAKLSGKEGLATLVARWAADAEASRGAYRRLFPDPSLAAGEELEYWQFEVMALDRTGPPSGNARRPAVEVLDGRRLICRPGVRIGYVDRWGNRGAFRLDAEPNANPPRYRLNGLVPIEPGIPIFAALRDAEIRISRYETSDVRLGPYYLPMPRGRRLVRLCHVRPLPPDAARTPAPDPEEAWRDFRRAFVEGLTPRTAERSFPVIRDLDLREAIPFLREGLAARAAAPPPSGSDYPASVARLLLEMNDPAGGEYLKKDLDSSDVRRRTQAALSLAASGDRPGMRALIEILRQPSPASAPYQALSSLDAFLRGADPSPEEYRDVMDLVLARLSDPPFTSAGFSIVAGQAGTDFGYSTAFRVSGVQAPKGAQGKAIEAARTWWAERRKSLESGGTR
jgi:HEAT repeat protein